MLYFLHNYDLNDLISWLIKLVGLGQQPGWWTAAHIKKYFDKGIADVLYKPSTMCKASTTEGMPKIKTDF